MAATKKKVPDALRVWALFERRAGKRLKEIAADAGVSINSVSKWGINARVDPMYFTTHPSLHQQRIKQGRRPVTALPAVGQ